MMDTLKQTHTLLDHSACNQNMTRDALIYVRREMVTFLTIMGMAWASMAISRLLTGYSLRNVRVEGFTEDKPGEAWTLCSVVFCWVHHAKLSLWHNK